MSKLARFFPVFLPAFLPVLLALLVTPAPAAQLPGDARGHPTLAPLVNEVTPAVVNISVVTRSPMEDNPLFRDPFFRRFFNLPDKPPPQQEQAAGSGVIVDAAKGYVITNNHVIRQAERIVVTLKDRRQFPAKLIGTDPGTDVAVLQIPAQNLTALRFGDSDALQVGDYVIAIGNPFGIGQTVTSGIVSALGRSGLSPEGYEDFIQTDASINPGNSGGPLINLRGELIGINTAILGPGGNIGIGFAIPSNMARAVVSQIDRFGEVRRGRLGIAMEDLTAANAKKAGVTKLEGALIAAVQPGSPAEKIGLREGDVIVALNGRAVRSAAELRARLGLTPVGEEVELRILRGNETRNIKTKIAAPQEQAPGEGRAVAQLPGMKVVEIERGSELYKRLRGGGLVVADVEKGSRAFEAGFREADIIYAVNRKRVQSAKEFQAATKGAKGGYAVSVLRGDFSVTITVR
jgi:Do/DeqQ family serine protease